MRLVHHFFFVICLFVAGCATSIPVETDYDPEHDFSGLQKYDWYDQVRAPNQLVEDRIRGTIDEVLVALGYSRVESGGVPDFRVSFTAVAEQAMRMDTVSSGMGYRRRNWSVGLSYSTRTREYNRGTLIIDIIDASGEDLLWRGASARALDEGRTPEEKTSDVNEIVTGILQKFPPQPD